MLLKNDGLLDAFDKCVRVDSVRLLRLFIEEVSSSVELDNVRMGDDIMSVFIRLLAFKVA
jgi:hypothetical protein